MNKIDILLDILEFKPPSNELDPYLMTVELLNSGCKKFKISEKQYLQLKESIENYNLNVYTCFSDYSFIWSSPDKFSFLKVAFSGKMLTNSYQELESHKVLLSCNSNDCEQEETNLTIGELDELVKEVLNHNLSHLFNIDQISESYGEIGEIEIFQKNTSYPYQNDVTINAYLKKQYGIFMEPGMGKSKTALDTAATLLKNGLIKNCLIFPPANLIENWTGEIKTHVFDELHDYFQIISNKNLEKKTKNLKEITRIKHEIKDLKSKKEIESIINAKKMELDDLLPISEKYLREIKSGETLIIIDEYHNFKNPQSQKTKYLLSLLTNESKILLLTGTPFSKDFQDMYVTFKIFGFLNSGINWFKFKNEFFDPVYNGFGGVEKLILKPKLEKLKDLLILAMKKKSSWLKKSDELDLPEQNYVLHYYTPSEEQKAVINLTLNEMPIPEGIDLKKMPFSNKELKGCLIKIMQIQGGFYLKDDKYYELEINNKFKLLVEILEKIKNEKIIIFCVFTAEADLITKKLNALGFRCICKHGKLKKKISSQAINDFKSENFDILVATGDSAGTGLTLIDGCNIIYYSNNFNFITREQTEGRIHRVGQKRNCVYHDLLSVGGVDEIIYNCLKRKMISKSEMFSKLRNLKQEAKTK